MTPSPRNIFRFKQFTVDQEGCAMRINTDGVLLGALSRVGDPGSALAPRILDVGTGTGVIALMLAQRFPVAQIDAIELDRAAAWRAASNFENSPFSRRLCSFHAPLAEFDPVRLRESRGYDSIISNPPFFMDSLKSDDPGRQMARHTSFAFFETLCERAGAWLSRQGTLQLILPPLLAGQLESYALQHYGFSTQRKIEIYSFATDDQPIRMILELQKSRPLPKSPSLSPAKEALVIYEAQGLYSEAYQSLLSEFLLIF